MKTKYDDVVTELSDIVAKAFVSENIQQLQTLKKAAIEMDNLKLAALMRRYIEEIKPPTIEANTARMIGSDLQKVLEWTGIQTDERTAWVMWKAMEIYKRRKGKFSLQDAATIKTNAEKLFP